MKPFELALWLSAVALLLRHLSLGLRGGSAATVLILLLSLLLIVAQLFYEGWRRPILFAAMALLLLAALPLLLSLFKLPPDGLIARLTLALATLLLAASTVSNWLRPAVHYPQPGGVYPVIGVSTLPVLGVSPAGDLPTQDELRHPPPLLKLWYPAQDVPAPGLFDRKRIAERISKLGQRGSPFDAPALVDAPPLMLPTPLPLLFYFPGWPGTAIESTSLVRELVSHGYCVATVEYPAHQPGMSSARWQALKQELERPFYYGDEQSYRELVEVSKERVRSRARDASAALDRLAAWVQQPGQPFAGLYDASRAGIIGFSLGGAVATQTVNQDPRFITAVNLDGRHWAEGREQGAKRPMLMISEPLVVPADALQSSLPDIRYNAIEDTDDYTSLERNLARHGGMHVTIDGTAHFNFSDLALTSPIPRYTGSGPIEPLRAYAITYAYALAWFDRALKGRPSSLLDNSTSPFPEAQVSIWPAPLREGAEGLPPA